MFGKQHCRAEDVAVIQAIVGFAAEIMRLQQRGLHHRTCIMDSGDDGPRLVECAKDMTHFGFLVILKILEGMYSVGRGFMTLTALTDMDGHMHTSVRMYMHTGIF
jgi:hypothetical protein